MRDLFQLRDHFVQPTTNNYQLETRHKQYINNIWDITTVGFCMRFLDSERKESFNIPVYLRLPPPFRWDRDFLVATIEEQLLLVRDRSFSSMEVIPLEHW
ncbi:hypothetical protein GYMLUDRAFT_339796 [Collybiopsis luxurians FD-317 M1]|nr:hypothetical protein GYMLUDRAFT_339796 [Collybiopsis luxurians FD-317 M1]